MFLALGSQADAGSIETVRVAPAEFVPEFKGKSLAVIDLERNRRLETKTDRDGLLTFELPVSGSDGRMIMMIPEE